MSDISIIGEVLVVNASNVSETAVYDIVQPQLANANPSYLLYASLSVAAIILIIAYVMMTKEKKPPIPYGAIAMFLLLALPVMGSGQVSQGAAQRLGMNITITLFCGDGICQSGENCGSCENDCGVCPPFQQPQPSGGSGTSGGGYVAGSQTGFSSGFMCNETYKFLNVYKNNYTDADVLTFKSQIENLLKISVSLQSVQLYVDDYQGICGEYPSPFSLLSIADPLLTPNVSLSLGNPFYRDGILYLFTDRPLLNINEYYDVGIGVTHSPNLAAALKKLFALQKVEGEDTWLIVGIKKWFIGTILLLTAGIMGYLSYMVYGIRKRRRKGRKEMTSATEGDDDEKDIFI